MCVCHTPHHLCTAWTVSKLAKHQFSCPPTASRILLSFIMIIILHDNIWRKLPRWFSYPGHAGRPAGSVEVNQGRGEPGKAWDHGQPPGRHTAQSTPSPPSLLPSSLHRAAASREHVPRESHDDPGIEAPLRRGRASLCCPAEINKHCQSALLQ